MGRKLENPSLPSRYSCHAFLPTIGLGPAPAVRPGPRLLQHRLPAERLATTAPVRGASGRQNPRRRPRGSRPQCLPAGGEAPAALAGSPLPSPASVQGWVGRVSSAVLEPPRCRRRDSPPPPSGAAR
uniref:Uncharacterized protein n=1 Tax=Sphaerodactylus townsendi TaxID=933632 RepID=A0ACB8FVZ1_9SAUR